MRSFFQIFLGCMIAFLVSSCSNHIKRGDEFFMQAAEAVKNDSIIRAFSLIDKAVDKYRRGGDIYKEDKALIFLSLVYFSTDQKEKAYEILKEMETCFPTDEDYPLYLNYYRIKAFYKSIYEKNTSEAVALMDSVLLYDRMIAKENKTILNLDRLNKCEILLNGSEISQVRSLLDSVLESTEFPSVSEPQIYANLARWFDAVNRPDSAYKYAKLVVDKTSRIHEDIDNNIYALEIILRHDSVNNNLPEYIRYRNLQESLKDERLGERMKYGMAFVREQNRAETLRLKASTEKRTLIWISVSVFLATMAVLIFLIQKHKAALLRNEMTQLECDRLDAEAFRRKFENELLQRKISSKTDELAKANNEILELSQRLAQKKPSVSDKDGSYLQRLLDTAKINHPEFQQHIEEHYPDITKTESTLACLIKLNLSSEEITTAMSISKSGLIKARYRLRKRLRVESSAELDEFISRI